MCTIKPCLNVINLIMLQEHIGLYLARGPKELQKVGPSYILCNYSQPQKFIGTVTLYALRLSFKRFAVVTTSQHKLKDQARF